MGAACAVELAVAIIMSADINKNRSNHYLRGKRLPNKATGYHKICYLVAFIATSFTWFASFTT